MPDAEQPSKPPWRRHFRALLQELHPDYALNQAARGIFTECIRPAGTLFLAQGSVRVHGTFHHCFALTFTTAKPGFLNSPFWAGHRFDHSNTIFHAFENELRAPVRGPGRISGLSSSHGRRTGSDGIVRACTANAERFLVPYYVAQIAAAQPILVELLEYVVSRPRSLESPPSSPSFGHEFLRERDLSLATLADPAAAWRRLPLDDRLPTLVAASRPKFARFQAELPALLDAVRNWSAPG